MSAAMPRFAPHRRRRSRSRVPLSHVPLLAQFLIIILHLFLIQVRMATAQSSPSQTAAPSTQSTTASTLATMLLGAADSTFLPSPSSQPGATLAAAAAATNELMTGTGTATTTEAYAPQCDCSNACDAYGNNTEPKPWNTIRIGFLNAETGQLSSVARDFSVAIALAIEQIKRQGVLLPNHELVVDMRDTRLSQAESLADALQFALVEKADAVLGAITSAESKAAQLVLLNFNIAQLSFSATSPELSNRADFPFFVRNVPSDALQGAVMVQLVYSLGWRQFSLLATDDSYGRAGADQIVQSAQDLGMRVLSRQDYVTGSGVLPTRQIQTLKDSDARIFLFVGLVEDAILSFAEAMNQGLFGPE